MVNVLSRISIIILLLGIAGCGSEEAVKPASPEDMFKKAKELYDDGDYLQAIQEFNYITLQFQGSGYASQAQFYLGECRFQRHEYLLAATEYGILKRNYPASPFVPDAQYKLALSYYNLSPRSSLDQKYTKMAIDEFQAFVEYYPRNENVADADAKIRELNSRLARKLYEEARQYERLDYYTAALIYYSDVIERYHDTEYAPLAELDKVDLLINRKRYQEANTELTRFLDRYPNSVLRSRADALKQTLDNEWKPGRQTSNLGDTLRMETSKGPER